MSVSDLTGTTWVINEVVTLAPLTSYYSYNINFTSNNASYIAFRFVSDNRFRLNYDSVNAYYYFGGSYYWYNDNYRTITISGGNDAVDGSLISWFEANATQVLPEVYIKDIKIGNTTYPIAASKLLSSDTEYNLEVKPLSLGGNTYGIVSAQEPVNLIEFTVVGITYQAEDDMTWADWVSSQYNTNGTYISPNPPAGGDVHFAGTSSLLYVNRRQKVDAFDSIIEGWDYIPL